jgi:hypothetical protein
MIKVHVPLKDKNTITNFGRFKKKIIRNLNAYSAELKYLDLQKKKYLED